jgi:hypothetical protein
LCTCPVQVSIEEGVEVIDLDNGKCVGSSCLIPGTCQESACKLLWAFTDKTGDPKDSWRFGEKISEWSGVITAAK